MSVIKGENYPIFTVYVTPCIGPRRSVPEYQSHFIQTLLAVGYTPLVCSKGPVSNAALACLNGLAYYDDLESVLCSELDTSRRVLAVQEYRFPLTEHALLIVKKYMADPAAAEEEYPEEVATLLADGCFSGPPKSFPLLAPGKEDPNIITPPPVIEVYEEKCLKI